MAWAISQLSTLLGHGRGRSICQVPLPDHFRGWSRQGVVLKLSASHVGVDLVEQGLGFGGQLVVVESE